MEFVKEKLLEHAPPAPKASLADNTSCDGVRGAFCDYFSNTRRSFSEHAKHFAGISLWVVRSMIVYSFMVLRWQNCCADAVRQLPDFITTRSSSGKSWEFPLIWFFQTWLFAILAQKRSFALVCTLLRPFALFCGLAFVLFCAHLHSFCIRPRLEQPSLGTEKL